MQAANNKKNINTTTQFKQIKKGDNDKDNDDNNTDADVYGVSAGMTTLTMMLQ